MATYVQEGRRLDYTPNADVTAGTEVVIGDLLGIAAVDIKQDKPGALDTEGVWTVAKVTGVPTSNGARAYRETATGEWKEDSADAVAFGYFVGDQDNDDEECMVRLAP